MKNAPRVISIIAAIVLSLFSLLLYRTLELGRGEAKPAFLEILNPAGEFLGPEGLQFDNNGNLYIGDAQGIIWSLQAGGAPQIHAKLRQVRDAARPGESDAPIFAGGIAIDPGSNLYVAAYGYAGGSVLRIDSATRQVNLFARDLGVANYILITRDGTHLWVSDYRRRGRLLRYAVGGSMPAQPDRIIQGLESPNGLALGADERTIYAAETYSGNIAQVSLKGAGPEISRIANLRGTMAVGSLDGLAFDPRDTERRFLHVAQNLRGLITVLDLKASPPRIAKQIRLAAMGGRPCPASMTIRDGYLYFTDLWSCSPFRILLGIPSYRRYSYRLRVTDLSSIY